MNGTRWGRLLAAVAALIAFGVYWRTLAHTITWLHNGADSGDLVTAAFVYGIPHPPGYPLYTLIAFFFARNPWVEPAHGVTIFSALMASAAVFVLARAGEGILRVNPLPLFEPRRGSAEQHLGLGSNPLPRSQRHGTGEGSKAQAAVEPLATAPRPTEVAERGIGLIIPPIGALAFGLAPLVWSQATIAEVYALNLFFVSVVLWACATTSRKRVAVAALAFGLGMAHHPSILLLAPGALIALEPRRKDWKALILLVAPLLFYVYLPIAALPNPPVKWGDPITVERFVWLVTAAQYRPYLFGVDSAEVLSRFAFAARELLDQFTIVGVALILWGAIQLATARARLFVALSVMFVPVVAYAVVYASRDSFLYLLPAYAVCLLWMVYGAAEVAGWAGDDRLLGGAAVALFAVLPIYNYLVNYGELDVSHDRAAYEYAAQNFEGLSNDAVLFADGDEALFAVWYYRHAIIYASAKSVIVSQGLLQYDWYYDGLRRIMSEVKFEEPTLVTDAHARAREIMRVTFAEGRAICFTDSSPLLPEFEYEERGVLKCVIAEKASAE